MPFRDEGVGFRVQGFGGFELQVRGPTRIFLCSLRVFKVYGLGFFGFRAFSLSLKILSSCTVGSDAEGSVIPKTPNS